MKLLELDIFDIIAGVFNDAARSANASLGASLDSLTALFRISRSLTLTQRSTMSDKWLCSPLSLVIFPSGIVVALAEHFLESLSAHCQKVRSFFAHFFVYRKFCSSMSKSPPLCVLLYLASD